MNEKIKNALLSIYTESLKNPPKTLDGHIKNEIGITNDYRGRAIFEFFQNAIDRAENHVWIHLDKSKKTLTIANDGKPFSIEKEDVQNYSDLESLCSINTSSKNQNESIGNKGVGFKSCWEYTSKVSVCSTFNDDEHIEHWGFEMNNPLTIDKIIDPENKELNLWKNNLEYATVFKNNNNKVPSFYFPIPIEDANCYFNNTYGNSKTIITFHEIADNKIVDLEQKIKEFSEHQIFFVNQLQKLKDSKVTLELKIDDSIIKTLNTNVNSQEWLIVQKVFDGKDLEELQELSANLNYEIKLPKIAIAFPLKQQMKEDNENFQSNFYCYLPTEVKCGFNVLMHGDFLLDVSRKQIDFSNNPFNARLLYHLTELFVDSLLNKIELHSLPDFAKFLLPTNKDGKTESVFRELFFRSSNLTSILKRVYTSDRNWEIDSYSLIFDVIERWTRNHNPNENWDYYYNRIYNETIRHFCDPSIYIVPIIEEKAISYVDSLPLRESPKKLFYRTDENTSIESNILKELKNISITSFPYISPDYFEYTKVVKKYSTIEILRAVNAVKSEKNDAENDRIIYNEGILKFIFSLIQGYQSKTERQSFFINTSLEYQLARIKLPCIDGSWHTAIQCYTGINREISDHFKSGEFFELNVVECKKIIKTEYPGSDEITVFLRKLGIWESILPFQYINGNFKLPFIAFPQLKNKQLKILINHSIPDWQNLVDRDGLIKTLKYESWIYDEANKSFASPSIIFLFNDSRARHCISQELKTDELKELHRFFDIRSIEETEDSKKIIAQLEKMKFLKVVDEYHKTVYKQLVLRLSRLKDVNIKEIPLLTIEAEYISDQCWFTSNEYHRYVHHFPNYNFVNFDGSTTINFISNLSPLVNRFEPEFNIKPEMDQLKKDIEIKDYFEKEYLPDFFALAEKIISSADFDKEECIKRWNNLDIYKGHDVWLEVVFNGISKDLYKDVMKEVLYKPGSRTNKESVGLLAYDLADYKKDANLSKFGIAIAEAVFRNQNIGEILSNYIQKKQYNPQNAIEYLLDKGIGESEINQTKKFIDIALVSNIEMQNFLHAVNLYNNNELGINNWTDRIFYSDTSFNELRISVIDKLKSLYEKTAKFESLLEIINPNEANLKFIIDQKRYLQNCYYAHNQKELSNEEFDNIIIANSMVEDFFRFDFGISHCHSIFGIPFPINPLALEIAETALKIISIQRECGFSEKMELSPIISNGIKVQCISANGKTDTHTVRRTLQYHEDLARMQNKRGYGMEKILSLQYAQQLFEKNQNEFVKEIIHQMEDLKDLDIPERIDIETLSEILQVSTRKGDGLAYDVLQPVFDVNDKLKDFNLVEVKSSQNDSSIHLSENEREKILNFAQKDIKNWRLYHFVNGQNYDRTEFVLEAVKTHAESYKEEQLLIGVDWMIKF